MHARAFTTTVLLLAAAVSGCGDDDNANAQETPTTGTTAAPATTAPTTTAAPEPEGFEVRFDAVLPSPQYGTPVCDGETCMFPLSRTGTTVSGDFNGVAIAAGAGSATPGGGIAGANYQIFIGEVAPCGSGSVAWVDIASGAVDALAVEWRIVEGTGTGDLVGMSGGGTSDATFNADNSGTGTSVGVIECV